LYVSNIPLANRTLPYCGNITGATSDLCTLTATGDNESWNQSWAESLFYTRALVDANFTLYYTKAEVDANFSLYYPSSVMDANLSLNHTDHVYTNWNDDWSSTYNDTYDNSSVGIFPFVDVSANYSVSSTDYYILVNIDSAGSSRTYVNLTDSINVIGKVYVVTCLDSQWCDLITETSKFFGTSGADSVTIREGYTQSVIGNGTDWIKTGYS
jgi:hypothetical protein